MKAARLDGMAEGKSEGLAEGLAKGDRIGVIHFCERFLKRPETSTEKLQSLSLEELGKLVDELHSQVLGRK